MNPTFMGYQTRAHDTADVYERSCQAVGGEIEGLVRLVYVTLGLSNEAGEFAGKIKKLIRDGGGALTQEVQQQLAGELGDVLWYWAECCTVLGLNAADVAQANINKLKSRKERGKIQGDGDKR